MGDLWRRYGHYSGWTVAGWRRAGHEPESVWCNGLGNPYGCNNPTIPAGTATQHTRILGENYGAAGAADQTNNDDAIVWWLWSLEGTQPFGSAKCRCGVRRADPPFTMHDIRGSCHSKYVSVRAFRSTIMPRMASRPTRTLTMSCFRTCGFMGSLRAAFLDPSKASSLRQESILPIPAGLAGTLMTAAPRRWSIVLNLNYSTIEWNGCNQVIPGLVRSPVTVRATAVTVMESAHRREPAFPQTWIILRSVTTRRRASTCAQRHRRLLHDDHQLHGLW